LRFFGLGENKRKNISARFIFFAGGISAYYKFF
jgi:mannitol-specific phosphotransferase system IIBC component